MMVPAFCFVLNIIYCVYNLSVISFVLFIPTFMIYLVAFFIFVELVKRNTTLQNLELIKKYMKANKKEMIS